MARRAGEKFLSEDPVDLPKLEAKLAENDEAHVQSQPQYQPQSTNNSPWSGDEEAILLAKYAGDIYKCVTDQPMPTCGKASWENRRKSSNIRPIASEKELEMFINTYFENLVRHVLEKLFSVDPGGKVCNVEGKEVVFRYYYFNQDMDDMIIDIPDTTIAIPDPDTNEEMPDTIIDVPDSDTTIAIPDPDTNEESAPVQVREKKINEGVEAQY
ncbi:hypothetical protein E4U56_006228 [Claviceps arundinis]|uniref:Uncharacterized protein n=1 Tax=Claviceps arundinis TaxID=1623583 RepID=A0A9P7ML68_9HYPO|nr:hypothetical protein E4U56_006228 [Claviceps arundinis]